MSNNNKQLYLWLEIEFKRSNHKKYYKYFSEWIENVTNNQIDGFNKQMIGQITKSKIKH